VGKRTGGYERVLQSTDVDELHAQLLAGVRVLVVDDCEALELSNPAIPATHCSLVPGIDSGILHGTFGDDLSFFKSLLGRMLRDFADLALPVSLEDQASREQLMARVHKLKGSASIMGATRVIRLAGAAESALQQDRTIEVVERILRQLAAALATLGEDAASLLAEEIKPTSDETPAAGTGARPSGPTAQIRELQSLLESQNFAATDRFSALSRSLTEMLGEVRFNELCEAVDDLDFPRAARLLRETVSVKKRARTARVR
jgi:HPt (histidine-containing phosphotransfer) domain-containing protein